MNQNIANLQNKVKLLDQEIVKAEEALATHKNNQLSVSKEASELELIKVQLCESIEKLSSQLKSMKQNEVDAVSGKVNKVEQLKKDKAQITSEYRKEKDSIESEMKAIDEKYSSLAKGEGKKLLLTIDANYDEEYNKLQQKKKELAEQSKSISILQRKIEQCPSKTELAQYMHRFCDLYNEVNWRNEESKKYLNLYNTLTDTLMMCNQNLKYLKESRDTYQSIKSKKDKETFLKKLGQLVEYVFGNEKTMKNSIDKIQREKEQSDKMLEDMLTDERNYFRILNEFQKECSKNIEYKEIEGSHSAS